MEFDIISGFPAMFEGPLSHSMVRRACDRGLVTIRLHDLRDHATDRHRKIDDVPFGGGGGMILLPGPLFAAVESIKERFPRESSRTLLLCPQGTRYDQENARRLAGHDRLILICGHYEGVDERVRENLIDESVSIGDYVLTGGEIPAMVLVDTLTRLVPGALGDEMAARHDTFSQEGFDFPQYTRPADFRGLKVPEVLLSGNHEKIAAWRKARALEATARKRPDLLKPRAHDRAAAMRDH
jgi:tRNA (guanine37-N1)-methyltransferase